MKLEKLSPGMTVYSVRKTKMGNTCMNTISVYHVDIISVNREERTIEASWNGNRPQIYHEFNWSKWRLKKPLLITEHAGRQRLATREEIKHIAMMKDRKETNR